MDKPTKPNRPNRVKTKLPRPELAILSPCGNYARMTPNPYYKEEVEIYKRENQPKNVIVINFDIHQTK